jgi:hypothetical protein
MPIGRRDRVASALPIGRDEVQRTDIRRRPQSESSEAAIGVHLPMDCTNHFGVITQRCAIVGTIAATSLFFVMGAPRTLKAESPTGVDGAPGTYEEILRSVRTAGSQTVEETNEPAKLTLRELAAGQQAWRERIQSIRVDVTYRYQRMFDTSGDRAAIKTGKGVVPELRGRVNFAMKGDKRLIESTDLSPRARSLLVGGKRKRASKVLAVADPNTPDFRSAFDGKEFRRYEAANRYGIIEATKRLDVENDAVVYFESFFVPVTDSMLRNQKTEWNVSVALDSARYYKLLPKLEKVDGHLCHVATSGWDTIWIDPEEGFGLRRRVHFRRKSVQDPGQLSYVQICQDFVNAGKNVWLPTKTAEAVYTTYDQPPQDRGKLHWLKEVNATPVVEDLPDSTFRLEFGPGTVVADYVKNMKYLIPHGEETLDLVIDQYQRPHGRSVPRLLLWLNGAFLVALVVFGITRWRRGAPATTPNSARFGDAAKPGG